MPIEGQPLVIEPKYPRAKELSEIGKKPIDPEDREVKIRNRWWSRRLRCEVYIYEENGKAKSAKLPAYHHISYDIGTLGASAVWGLEQESAALRTLADLVSFHQFKQYMLTGMFLERSKRSQLTYMFRRLKPTVVLDARDKDENASTRILAALCMHPIAHYENTWAGAMCPTDDVIAHLMMMRGDEPMYWKRSTQHPPWEPRAGL